MSISENIQALLNTYGLTQADLARIAGVDNSTVSYWLKGSRRPREEAVRTICERLGLTSDDIMSDYYGLAGEVRDYARALGRKPTKAILELIRSHGLEPEEVSEIVAANDGTLLSRYSKHPEDRDLLRKIRVFSGKPIPLGDEPFPAYGIPAYAVKAGMRSIVPLVTLGSVHAGPFSDEGETERTVEVPASVLEHHPNSHALIVEGDCMDRFVLPGMAVVYDPDLEPRNGSVAIVETEDYAAVMRRWYMGGDTLLLAADSHGRHEDIVLKVEDGPVRVLGVVVWVQSAEEMS